MSDRSDIPFDVAAELEAIDTLDDQFDAEFDELDDEVEDAAQRSAGQARVGQDSILPTPKARAQQWPNSPDPITLDHLYELLTQGSPAQVAEHLSWALTDLLHIISRDDFAALAHKHSEALRAIAIINAAAALPEAIEALRACCAEAEDPRDRRLAASALLRFLNRPPSCRSPAPGGGAVERSETEGVNQVRERSEPPPPCCARDEPARSAAAPEFGTFRDPERSGPPGEGERTTRERSKPPLPRHAGEEVARSATGAGYRTIRERSSLSCPRRERSSTQCCGEGEKTTREHSERSSDTSNSRSAADNYTNACAPPDADHGCDRSASQPSPAARSATSADSQTPSLEAHPDAFLRTSTPRPAAALRAAAGATSARAPPCPPGGLNRPPSVSAHMSQTAHPPTGFARKRTAELPLIAA